MARSPNNRQVNVPIPKESEMEIFYREEAAENGVRLPTHFYQLLKDRYEYLTGKRSSSAWFLVGKAGVSSQNSDQAVPRQEESVITKDINDVVNAFGGEDE